MASLLAATSAHAHLRRAVRSAVRRLVARRAKVPSRLWHPHYAFLLSLFLFSVAVLLTGLASSFHAADPFLSPRPPSPPPPPMRMFSVPHQQPPSPPSPAPLLPPRLPPQLRHRVYRLLRAVSSAPHVLRTAYGLPDTVVACMSPPVALTLLAKLLLFDLLADPHTQILQPRARVLFVHTQNGLGNRLRALASGLAMARATHRVPVVVWERDPHLAASFQEVFTAAPNSSSVRSVIYDHVIVMDRFVDWSVASQQNHTWHPVSYMEKDGLGAEPGILLPFEMPSASSPSLQNWIAHAQHHPQLLNASAPLTLSDEPQQPPTAPSNRLIHSAKHVYFKSAYVARTQPSALSSRSVVNRELALLQPSDSVMRIVRQLNPNLLRRAIGVHIRSRSLARDNVHVRTRCEYTREGARVTDFWRSHSSLNVFVKKMKWAMRRQGGVKFFVAADDVAVVQSLRDLFGDDRILHIQRDCDDRFEGCVKYAMADLICLSKTRKIYGSNWSSFSEAAGRLGGKSVYLSGYHFGRRRGIALWCDRAQSRIYRAVDHLLNVWPSWLTLPWNRC